MPINTEEPYSPGWWLNRLSNKLVERRKTYVDLFDRYEGNSPVPQSLQNAPEAAQQFFKTARTNFAEMVVKAVRYPLRIQAVATSVEKASTGDLAAWQLMRSSGMTGELSAIHRNALVAGRAYGMVGLHPQWGPRFTAEDPREVITIQDPTVQAETIAAMKITHDDVADRDVAWLYLPGRVYRCSRRAGLSPSLPRWSAGAFEWDADAGGAAGMPLPAPFEDTIPIVPYRNEEGIGEFERHRDIFDRIDHMILQGMTIATYQAFKQRGIKVDPRDMPDYHPETGEKIDYDEVFSADPGALWRLPATAEMWESGAVDLTPVWTGVDRDIQKLSAVTFTPLAMFSPEGQNQSAEGAAFAREARTFKIEDRHDLFGESHARALSLLLALTGDFDRADPSGIRIIWRPGERYSLSAKAAAMAHTRGDLPFRTRAIDIWQASPEEADEMEQLREDDMLQALMTESAAASVNDMVMPDADRPAALEPSIPKAEVPPEPFDTR